MPTTLYTIGHSNHPIETFIDLLRQHGITTLVDVRSQPYSQWASQFNRELLKHDLEEARIRYVYMGDALGGRPPTDSEGRSSGTEHPDYKGMARADSYKRGIEQLTSIAQDDTTAIMCSEGDYHHCHRDLLITQTLVAQDVSVVHIKPDGSTDPGILHPEQLSLF